MKFKAQKESTGYLFMQICKLRRNQSNTLLAASGIYAGQDALLYYLDLQDGQTITALVTKMSIQYATISNMIDRMEAAGLLNREKDVADKRISRVYLTQKGKESVSKIADAWRVLETKTIRGLNDDERQQLNSLLKKVADNLSDLDL